MLNFEFSYVLLEQIVREGSQEDEDRLLDLDHRSQVQIVDVAAQLFHHLDSVLPRHLEVKQHQAHWHDGVLETVCFRQGFIYKFARFVNSLLAGVTEITALEQAKFLDLRPDHLYVDHLVFSYNDPGAHELFFLCFLTVHI